MTELINLSTEVLEQARNSSEALGLELNNITIVKLGAKSIQIMFELNDWSGVNE